MTLPDLDAINQNAVRLGRKALDDNLLPGEKPGRFLFVTISGAHIYGFPSPDSDLDLRGAHVLPLRDVIGLRPGSETYDSSAGRVEGIEIDCVSHDLRKYLKLLSKKNGYVLEQIFSPLVVYDAGLLEELRQLARGAMTRFVFFHYRGFYHTQEKLILKSDRPTAKAVLYLFRVALTGVHLLKSGEVETDLLRLHGMYPWFRFLPELVERKMTGGEKDVLQPGEREAFLDAAGRLFRELETAFESSALPEQVQNVDALNDFLIRERLRGLNA